MASKATKETQGGAANMMNRTAGMRTKAVSTRVMA